MSKYKAVPTSEKYLLKACLYLLAAEKIWHMRMNTGAMRDGKRFVRFGKPGTADILAIDQIHRVERYKSKAFPQSEGLQLNVIHQHVIWIECKTPVGKMSRFQELFAEDVREQGHTYLLIRDIDELRNWLKENR